MSNYADLDPFWVKNRADFLAAKSAAADPSACNVCCDRVAAGEPVKHDECAQRATLLQAPDHPYYEILAGFSLEENEKLPARFHIPVFDDCGVPNSWLCAVCQEEGVVTGWPCATATKYGTQVFTPQHAAETEAKKQAARIARLEGEIRQLEEKVAGLEDDRARLLDQQAKDDDELAQATAERDRYRLAWQSASFRAEARGEGIERIVKDRESYQGWLKQEQELTQQLRARIAELSAPTPVSQHYDKVPDPADGCHWCACGNRWPCKHAGEVTA